MRDLVKATLAIAISLLTIVAIFKVTNVQITIDIEKLDIRYLLVALLLQLSFWFLWALRLKLITGALGKEINYSYSFKVTLSSMFFAAITPSSAGGEPVRVKLIGDVCGSYGKSSAVVLIERLLDAIFFAISLPIFLILTDFAVGFGFRVAGIFTIFLILFLLVIYLLFEDPERLERFIVDFNKKFLIIFLKDRVERITEKMIGEAKSFRMALIEFVRAKKTVTITFITVVMWMLGFLIPSFILLAMRCDPYYLLSITSQLIIVVVSLIPLTPGSSGIAEGSMAYLYSNFVPQSVLGILVAIWRFITYYTNLFLGFVFSLSVSRRTYAMGSID
ncbi:MAG: hypothetical protein DRP01_06610 [Archaeoglobales archaeon]|nr:MAG: hypothetical protein DRP01_06610 [Archaeoglobales archaeon]